MHSIKILGFICAMYLVAQAKELNDDEKQMIMMFTEDCRKAHKISDKEIYDMMAGNVPDSQSAKCAVGCLMKQYKMMKDDKLEMDVDKMVGLSEAQGASKEQAAMVREVGEKCKAPPAADECEFAALVSSCFKKEGESRGITLASF